MTVGEGVLNAISNYRDLTAAPFLQDDGILLASHDRSVNCRSRFAQEFLSSVRGVVLRQNAPDLELDELLIASHAAFGSKVSDRKVPLVAVPSVRQLEGEAFAGLVPHLRLLGLLMTAQQ